MQKKFVGNLAFLLLVNLLVKPFWILGIDREVQNIVGSVDYGEYFVLFNLTLLLNIILDLGVTNFNNRNIARDNEKLDKHLAGIITLKTLLGFVYLLVILIAAFLFNYSEDRLHLLIILAVNQFIVSFILYLRSNIAALHLFKLDALLSVLDRILMIVFCSLLIWGSIYDSEITIAQFVYAQTASYAITLIVSLLVVLNKTTVFKFKIDFPFILSIVKKSMPYAFLVLLMYFYHRMDTIMLDWLLDDGSYASGVYAQGYRLLDAYNMLAFLTAGILYPSFSKMIKERQDTEKLMRLSFGMLFTAALGVSVSCAIYTDKIMSFLYNSIDAQTGGVFNYLIFASIPISISYVFGTLLTANGNLQTLNFIAFGGVIVNFVLNFWLIPVYGAKGSAFATLVTQVLAVGGQVIAVFLIFNYHISRKPIFSLFLFIIGGLFISYLIELLDILWFYKLIFSLLGFAIAAIFSGLYNLKGLSSLISYQKR